MRKKFIAQIDKDKCTECGKCKKCSKINHPKRCSGCEKCIAVCPVNAISLVERTENDEIKAPKSLEHKIEALIIIVGFSTIIMLYNSVF